MKWLFLSENGEPSVVEKFFVTYHVRGQVFRVDKYVVLILVDTFMHVSKVVSDDPGEHNSAVLAALGDD